MPYADLVAQPDTLSRNGTSTDHRAGEIQEIVSQLRKDFEARDDRYARIERTIHRETAVKIPDAYDKTATVVHSPMASHIVNTIVAALSVNQPTVQFRPTGFGTGASENATLRERFFEASWLRQERESKRRLFRLFMYSLVAKGEGVLKTVERSKTAWGGYRAYATTLKDDVYRDPNLDEHARDRYYNAKTEEYKRDSAPYPIATTDVLPETFYYLKGIDGFTLFSEVKDVPYLDTLARFDMGLDAKGHVVPAAIGLPLPEWQKVMRGAGSTLKMIEVWVADSCTYLLLGPGQLSSSQSGSRAVGRGTVVSTIKNHGYGNHRTQTLDGPYFQALGVTTAHRLPDKSGLGVLDGFLDLFPLLDSMLTIAHNNAVMTGFASFKKVRPASEQAIRPRSPSGANPYGEDGDEDDEQEEPITPGYVYPDDIEPIEMPKAGVDFDKFITIVRNFMELALPSIVQGVVSGDESGYALNQAAHLARLAWDPILDNAEFALSDRVGFESRLIENHVAERVYAQGEVPSATNPRRRASKLVSISPDDLKGNHSYAVHLNPQTPSNKALEVKLHADMVASHFESEADAVEALGGSWDDVQRQRLYEEFIAQEDVKKRIFERAQQKLGWIDAQKLGQAREELALADAPQPGPGDVSAAGGGNLGTAGAVFDPAMGNMPGTPTPQGSVTGVGPPGAAMAQQGGGGRGGPGGPLPGTPSNPGLPARNIPLPGR